jgi:hypothetical protein
MDESAICACPVPASANDKTTSGTTLRVMFNLPLIPNYGEKTVKGA